MAEKIRCPKCGRERELGENFCGDCGYPLPMGNIICPDCKKETRASSKFCSQCGKEINEVSFDFISKRWHRGPTDLAVRMDNVDAKNLFKKDIIIDPGTKALFFQDGKFCTELSAGYYKLEGFFERIKKFLNIAIPMSIVIVDAADVELQMSVGELFTKEDQVIEVDMRMVFQLEKPELFFVNLLKGKDKYSRQELESFLIDEVKNVLQESLKSKSIEELYGNLELKRGLEQSIESKMKVTLERTGLRAIQLRVIDFHGDAYNEVRKSHGDVYIDGKWIDIEEARGKLNERMRQVLTLQEIDKFRNEAELESFIRQQEHELGIKGVIRDAEMAEFKRIFRENTEKREFAHIQIMDRLRLEHEIAQTTKKKLADGEWKLKDVDVEVEALRRKEVSEIELEEKERESKLKTYEKFKKIKLDAKERELKILSETTIEALIAKADPDQAKSLLELQKVIKAEKMTPEQILAEAARSNPAAADALGKKFAAEGMFNEQRMKDLQKAIDDIQKRDGEWADRLKEVMNTALGQMGRTAEAAARGQGQTIVTGPGSQTIATGGDKGLKMGKVCPKCGTQVGANEKFCPECRHEL